ncbi:hypothetical protein V6N12_018591 [Hibiscus sabdariffa]|uniref:Uncharacterized protein n=1 Tax=Hibiscus sabdariffa TaxID=183260 RepID=A0ABR2A912_9ROSI
MVREELRDGKGSDGEIWSGWSLRVVLLMMMEGLVVSVEGLGARGVEDRKPNKAPCNHQSESEDELRYGEKTWKYTWGLKSKISKQTSLIKGKVKPDVHATRSGLPMLTLLRSRSWVRIGEFPASLTHGLPHYLLDSQKKCSLPLELTLATRASIVDGWHMGYNNAIFTLAPYGEYWREIWKMDAKHPLISGPTQ